MEVGSKFSFFLGQRRIPSSALVNSMSNQIRFLSNLSHLSQCYFVSSRSTKCGNLILGNVIADGFSSTFNVGAKKSQYGALVRRTILPMYHSRSFSNSYHRKLAEVLRSELQQEKASNSEMPPKVKKFLSSGVWTLREKLGDVNLSLSREVNGKRVSVDFQLVNPSLGGEEGDEEAGNADDEADGEGETTDFSVTIEELTPTTSSSVNNSSSVIPGGAGGKLTTSSSAVSGPSGAGVTFYCTTVAGDKFRYLIGNIRLFNGDEQKNSVSAYNGPEFEGLAPSLQESLESYLENYGINNDLCDVIDELAIDKETREYMNWLNNFIKFVED